MGEDENGGGITVNPTQNDDNQKPESLFERGIRGARLFGKRAIEGSQELADVLNDTAYDQRVRKSLGIDTLTGTVDAHYTIVEPSILNTYHTEFSNLTNAQKVNVFDKIYCSWATKKPKKGFSITENGPVSFEEKPTAYVHLTAAHDRGELDMYAHVLGDTSLVNKVFFHYGATKENKQLAHTAKVSLEHYISQVDPANFLDK